jgi:transposase
MFFVGIDLHQKTITVCVVSQELAVISRRTLYCCEPDTLVNFFQNLKPFQAVVEATASYEWLWQRLEPLADRLVLAHPKKMRIIAESKRKSDKSDAQVLAEALARDELPEAYRPTPRQRQHRVLVRFRCYARRRGATARTKIRRILADYNIHRRDLFTANGLKYLSEVPLSAEDRFVVDQLVEEWHEHQVRVRAAEKRLRQFAQAAPSLEAEARVVLRSIPGVGPVTVDVVLSELADIRRFRSAKDVMSYAGLTPGLRESAGKRKELPITKEGSRLLRWALVEAAWRLVRQTQRWRNIYENLKRRRGAKKAIVAVARRILGVITAVWRSGQPYRHAA